jgi:hypothetical protein
MKHGVLLGLLGVVAITALGVLFFGGQLYDLLLQKSETSVARKQQPAFSTSVGQVVDEQRTVSYTESGFSPFIVEIVVGGNVRVVNESSEIMRLAKIPREQGSGDEEPVFVEQIAPGASVTMPMLDIGAWGYRDERQPHHAGIVLVLPPSR